jgi:hypothetical protein
MLVAKLGLRWSLTRGITINPVIALWRSAYAPVWNHHIDRPALLWDSESGVAEETLAAVKEGRGDRVRLPAPTPDELRAHLDDELTVSLRALRGQTRSTRPALESRQSRTCCRRAVAGQRRIARRRAPGMSRRSESPGSSRVAWRSASGRSSPQQRAHAAVRAADGA